MIRATAVRLWPDRQTLRVCRLAPPAGFPGRPNLPGNCRGGVYAATGSPAPFPSVGAALRRPPCTICNGSTRRAPQRRPYNGHLFFKLTCRGCRSGVWAGLPTSQSCGLGRGIDAPRLSIVAAASTPPPVSLVAPTCPVIVAAASTPPPVPPVYRVGRGGVDAAATSLGYSPTPPTRQIRISLSIIPPCEFLVNTAPSVSILREIRPLSIKIA